MLNKNIKKKKGFSLVETLIALLVFSFIIVMLMGSFSSLLKNYANVKKTQRGMESAQYVINMMAKTIRSSVFPSAPTSYAGVNQITMFDNSRSLCVTYKYDTDGLLKVFTAAGTVITDCDTNPSAASFTSLTAPNELSSFSFSGVPTDITDPMNPVFGKISITADAYGGNAAKMQTTVSLRQ
ncbi:MAG: hypothetical protein US57_C0010G0009 [Candidatus Moranbacteria bacterium GW2011_GWC2_37_73]|nr:MAG: hypothetical protein UR95_C0008G0021 [Parcubacteria group bacterium GW2011_GWC1_36_108]KKQ00764.1 MAG: hypothetical protein US09_C0006G0009 [Candidatus Moranbacteria bacterium GW2011_GWD1_36_198]KKQ02225.1 MAG: hypothetical protein US10_C0005G0005 [Candidatus Moranbacteria bacterium GW2011_GWD2_36_198]KKQ39690.1 MAG: hypothetical protein US57_C0010G0009 [Candidatus Moranbacteria bacterium GW2011_GWC2_37_73]HAR99642.1 hypothetical protein [Candidatus Moranbacteria bacterium]